MRCACHEICTSRFTMRCACHEICTSRFTKCCACHEICTSRFTKSCTCHEICTSRFTKCCACHEICTSRSTKFCACHEICTKCCTCHEICANEPHTMSKVLHLPRKLHFEVKQLRSLAPGPKARGFPCACHENVPKCARRHNESAVARSSRCRQADFASLRSRNAHGRCREA